MQFLRKRGNFTIIFKSNSLVWIAGLANVTRWETLPCQIDSNSALLENERWCVSEIALTLRVGIKVQFWMPFVWIISYLFIQIVKRIFNLWLFIWLVGINQPAWKVLDARNCILNVQLLLFHTLSRLYTNRFYAAALEMKISNSNIKTFISNTLCLLYLIYTSYGKLMGFWYLL